MAVLSRLSWPSGCAASLCSYRRDKFAGHSKHRLAFAVTQLSAELDEGYRIEKFRNELETQETLVSKRPCRSHERQRVGLAVCGRGLFGRAVRRAPHTACPGAFKTQASAMEKFNELEDEIAAMKQQLQVRMGGAKNHRVLPRCRLAVDMHLGGCPFWHAAATCTPCPNAHQADREELAAWERASAEARSKGLFFKQLYAPPADSGADSTAGSKGAAGSGGSGGSASDSSGPTTGAERFAGQLLGTLDPEAAEIARQAAARVKLPAEEEVGSPIRLWLFAYMASALALVVGQGATQLGLPAHGHSLGRSLATSDAPCGAYHGPHSCMLHSQPPHRPGYRVAFSGLGCALRCSGTGARVQRLE